MSSELPSNDELETAWAAREAAHQRYYELHAPLILTTPTRVRELQERLSADLPVLRVLHAISVGYGWSTALHEITEDDALGRACDLGLVVHLPLRRAFVLTESGVNRLHYWYHLITPLRDTEPFTALWREVTGLEARRTN